MLVQISSHLGFFISSWDWMFYVIILSSIYFFTTTFVSYHVDTTITKYAIHAIFISILVLIMFSGISQNHAQEEIFQNNIREIVNNSYFTVELTVEDKAVVNYSPGFPMMFFSNPVDHYLVKFTNGKTIRISDIFDFQKLEPGKTYQFAFKRYIDTKHNIIWNDYEYDYFNPETSTFKIIS